MKEKLIQVLAGNKGRFTTAVAALLTGFLVKLFTQHNLTWDPAFEDAISAASGLGVGWAIDNITLRIQTSGIKQIQEALPEHVKVDGVARHVTIEAVQVATGNLPAPQDEPEPQNPE